MKMPKYATLALACFTLFGCEKEIEIPYRDVDKLYVVEANLSNDRTAVELTQTRNMNDSIKGAAITTAHVSITDGNGVEYPLVVQPDGSYCPTESIAMESGKEYALAVQVGDNQFTATATLYAQPLIVATLFTKQQFMEGVEMVFCSFAIQDTPQQDNYYRYRLSINGYASNWNLIKDLGQDGNLMWQYIPLIAEPEEGQMMGEIQNGDEVFIEVQSVDRGVYDYYYSLSLSGSSASNPISNIEGGCLGYFAAVATASNLLVYDESLLVPTE